MHQWVCIGYMLVEHNRMERIKKWEGKKGRGKYDFSLCGWGSKERGIKIG